MNKTAILTATLVALCICGGAVAQDSLQPPGAPPEMIDAPAGSGEVIVPDNGQEQDSSAVPDVTPPPPLPAQPEPGAQRTSAVEQFDAWSAECFAPPFAEIACQATLRVIAQDASQVVMVFALTGKEDADIAVQMALPLGISLEAAVQIVIGDEYQNRVPISRCTPAGCLVEGRATAELIDAMRASTSGVVVVETETGEKIQLPFSLMGFSQALRYVLNANAQIPSGG